MEELFGKIEFMRQMMHEAVLKKGLSHPDVLQISQNLDMILNECYKLRYVK